MILWFYENSLVFGLMKETRNCLICPHLCPCFTTSQSAHCIPKASFSIWCSWTIWNRFSPSTDPLPGLTRPQWVQTRCRSADCISCWRSSCIWIRLPPQVGMSSAHRDYLRTECLMENVERQSAFRNSSWTSNIQYCSSFLCYHRGHLHENRMAVFKHSSALAACCLFWDLMPVESQASDCLENKWVRDGKRRSGGMQWLSLYFAARLFR